MEYVKYTVLVFVLVWLILFVITGVFGLQNRFVFNPSMPVGKFIGEYPGVLQKYTQKTAAGNEIALWVVEGDAQKPVIILSHGRSAHKNTVLPLIKTLAENGNTVIIYSYSGYPPSTGRPSEQNTYDDIYAVIKFAEEKLYAKPGHIILAGHSLGAAVAIDAASRGDYHAVIAMVPFSSIPDVMKVWSRKMPLLHIFRVLPVKYRFDNAAKAGKITSPFYMFYSKEDYVTPYVMAEKLREKNKNIVSFAYERGHHNDTGWFAADLADVIKKIND